MRTIKNLTEEAAALGITIPEWKPDTSLEDIDTLADMLEALATETRMYANWRTEGNKITAIYFSRRHLHVRVAPHAQCSATILYQNEKVEMGEEKADEFGWVTFEFAQFHRMQDRTVRVASVATDIPNPKYNRDFTMQNISGYSQYAK